MLEFFDEDKQRIWIDFFRKIGVQGYYNKLYEKSLDLSSDIMIESIEGHSIKKPPIKDLEYPPIPEMMPIINQTIAEKPNGIKLFGGVFSEYNSRPPYSISESINKITESLNKSLAKYSLSNIPLVYTTLKLPSQKKFYGYDTWEEIKNVSSFENPDYGNINFVKALLKLEKRGTINIRSFKVVAIDNSQTTVKAIVYCKKAFLRLKNGKELITKNKRGEFYYKDPETGRNSFINIGIKTISYAVLEIVYENESNDPVSYEIIEEGLLKKGLEKAKNSAAMIKRINNAVINEGQGLQKAKVDGREFSAINLLPDGDKIIKTVRGKGIKFRNYL